MKRFGAYASLSLHTTAQKLIHETAYSVSHPHSFRIGFKVTMLIDRTEGVL